MIFKLPESNTFRFPVELRALREDGGVQKQKVRFEFKRLESDELQAYIKGDLDLSRYLEMLERANGDQALAGLMLAAEDQKSGSSAPTSADRADDLWPIVAGWEEIGDAEGSPLSFSRDNLIRLLNACPTAHRDIRQAYVNANSLEGKRGN